MSISKALRLRESRVTAAGIGFTVSTAVVIALWLQFHWGGEHTSTVMDDVTQILAPLFAAACCFVAARRALGRQRVAWALLGCSAAAWSMGSGVWAYYEVVRGAAIPYPSLADAGFLSAVPLAAAALLAFFPRGQAIRHLLDGLLVAGALLAISWATVIEALFAAHAGTTLEKALGLAYPIGDVILLTLAISLLASVRAERRLSLMLICGGIFVYAVADSLFTFLTATQAYSTINGMDVLWIAGYYLIGLAALVPAGRAEDQVDRRMGAVTGSLPYAVVTAAVVVVAVVSLRGGGTLFYRADVLGLFIVLLVRQGLTLRENRRLTRHLEERVADRTRELAGRERHFRALIQRSSDSTTLLDVAGHITYQSPAIRVFLGYRPGEVVGRPLSALLDPEDAVRLDAVLADLRRRPQRSVSLELHLEHRDGTVRIGEATLTNLIDDSDVGGVIVNMRDITMRTRLREQLAHNTVHDGLTGLPNRTLFNERLAHSLRRSQRNHSTTTVLFIDIDSFKAVNDTRGHAVGDAVIAAAATRIESCVRDSDTVARLGGDEFGIILEGAAERAHSVATRIVDAMRAPVSTCDGEVATSVSVGAATAKPGDEPDAVVRHADIAMYQAKAGGRDRVALYDRETHAQRLDALQLQSDLRVALQRNQLRVHFQPIVELSTGSTVGLEALLRWVHPARGVIAPDEFIPAAERAGVMGEIGRWTLREACRLAGAWFRGGSGGLDWISVNLSPVQLGDGALIDDVRGALQTSGLAPSHLVLELTESGLMTAPEQTRTLLTAVRELGVRVAVDDFGTGYSSLSYLEQFPIDILKVDRSVVSSAHTDGELSALARTILDLSHNLRMRAIAEGVEHSDQARTFLERGCEMGQGYLFGRPMPAEEVEAYLAQAQVRLRVVPASA